MSRSGANVFRKLLRIDIARSNRDLLLSDGNLMALVCKIGRECDGPYYHRRADYLDKVLDLLTPAPMRHENANQAVMRQLIELGIEAALGTQQVGIDHRAQIVRY